MMMQKLNDKRLTAIGYDMASMTMRVEFPPTKSSTQGSIYDYFEVPMEVFKGLERSQDKGQYFADNVVGQGEKRNKMFRYAKLNGKQDGDLYVESKTQAAPEPMKVISEKNVQVITEDFLTGTKTTEPLRSMTPEQVDQAVAQANGNADPVPAEVRTTLEAAIADVQERATKIVRAQPDTRAIVLVVDTPEMYATGAEELKEIARRRKVAAETFDGIKRPLNEALTRVRDLEKTVLGQFDAANQMVERGLTSYRNQKELEARQAAEEARKVEQARLDAEAAERTRQQKEENAREAERLKALNQPEMARAVEQRPTYSPAAVAQRPTYAVETPKVDGIAVRGTWKVEIEDQAQIPLYFRDRIAQAVQRATTIVTPEAKLDPLVLEMAAIFSDFYSIDEVKVRGFIKPKKELGVGLVPGVRAWLDEKTGTTGR